MPKPKFRTQPFRPPKEKKGKAAEPDLNFKVFTNECKFLIYLFDFHPFLTDNDFIIKCLYYRYLLVGNEKVKKKTLNVTQNKVTVIKS